MSNNRRRLCQTFLNYTQNHEKISSVIARIYRPDVCLFKRRSRSAGWIAYPRQPGRARSRNDPRRISPHLPTQVFRFDRNGELSRYEASLVVRIDCPGNINAGEGAYMCDATGIEACTNLRYLNLSGNDLTKLDVSNNKLLDTLDCSINTHLKNLRVAKQESLATALLCLFS